MKCEKRENNEVEKTREIPRQRKEEDEREEQDGRTSLRHRFRSLVYHLFIQTVITYTSGESESRTPVSEMTNSGTPQGSWEVQEVTSTRTVSVTS